MQATNEVASVKNFFQSHQINLSNIWLESCIHWCKEENLPSNYTMKDLQLKIYEQWLLLDLRDMEMPCLPPNISDKKLYILNGIYSLQMMQMIDISKPKHWQLQRIRNGVPKNIDHECESGKRVLQLTLTDGVQEVEAMEYKFIPHLNLNLTPGIKVRLMGPINVRRGRLLLENHNIKILGGEVEDLIIPNAAENVLAKFLKLTINPSPKIIEESLLTANKDMFEETVGMVNKNVETNRNIHMNGSYKPPTGKTSYQNQEVLIPPEVNKKVNKNNFTINEEEEMRIIAEIDTLMEVETEFEQLHPIRKSNNSPDLFDDMGISDEVFFKINIPNTRIENEKNTNQLSTVKNNLSNEQTVLNCNNLYNAQNKLCTSNSSDLDNDLLDGIVDIESFVVNNKKNVQSKPSGLPKKIVVITIEKLLNNLSNITNGKFKIKARFHAIVEKLTVVNEEYYLVVKVEDDSGSIAVRIHSDVVANLAGCYPAALMSLKTGAMENNSEACNKVLETLKRIKEKLIQLDNIVEVLINAKEKYPVIVNIIDIK